MTALLEVQNLHKSYGSLKVTEDISFSINRGEALGVIGPNGAGKSTLFNLIAGGIRPDSGTVLFNGLDVTNFHLHERSIKGIGRSFQIPHPFGGMTVFGTLFQMPGAGMSMLSGIEVSWVIGLGLAATIGHAFIVWAAGNAPANLLAPFQYVEIIGAATLGYLVFGDVPATSTFVGVTIIIASGLYLLHREGKAEQRRKSAS